MNTILDFSEQEWNNVCHLIDDFQSYYEDNEKPWSFGDVDNQREIACELIRLLANKLEDAKTIFE